MTRNINWEGKAQARNVLFVVEQIKACCIIFQKKDRMDFHPEDTAAQLKASNMRSFPEIRRSVARLSIGTKFIPTETTVRASYADDPTAPNDSAHLLFFLYQHVFTSRDRITPAENIDLVVNQRSHYQVWPGHLANRASPYQRVLFFADCAKKGRVACKILRTELESLEFFRYMTGPEGGDLSRGIGYFYVMEEHVQFSVVQNIGK